MPPRCWPLICWPPPSTPRAKPHHNRSIQPSGKREPPWPTRSPPPSPTSRRPGPGRSDPSSSPRTPRKRSSTTEQQCAASARLQPDGGDYPPPNTTRRQGNEHHLVRHRPARQGHPATARWWRPPAHQPDHEEQAPLSVGHSISPPPRDMWAAQSLIGLGSFSEAREKNV